MWQREFSIVAQATPTAVWQLFADVSGWPRWNAGIERIALRGPFREGTLFDMQPPGQEAFTSRLTRVEPGRGFTDETEVGEVKVVVDHRIEPLEAGWVRVVYSARVEGPAASEIGTAVTEDFPQVLAGLARAAATAEAA